MSKVFEGTWVTSSAITGFDEFMDKIGLGDKEKDKLRDAVVTINFKVDGNKIPWTTVSSANPDEKLDFTAAEFGKEFEIDTKTSKIKMLVTKISDNEIHQSEKTNYGDGVWREFLIKRKVKGDEMDVEIIAVEQKVSTSYCMKRKSKDDH